MRRRAFTLIELLVIIGIIAVLVAILIPTLSAIYAKGYKTRSQAVMNDLQSALATYYTHFRAYPGPANVNMTAPASGAKISGAQNLLLGLSYSLAGPNGTIPASISIILPPPVPQTPRGVVDYASTNPDGTHPAFGPYFSPVLPGGASSPRSSVGMVTAAAVSGFTSNTSLPVVIDAFSDALPILYYRRTPGDNTTVAQAATTAAAYYVNDNIEYTGSNSLSGINLSTGIAESPAVTFDETTGGLGGASAATYLSNLVGAGGAGGPAHGSYLLIDAGPDRIFGTADDIVIVGE